MVFVNPAEGVSFAMDGYLVKLLTDLKDAVLTKNTSSVTILDGKSGKGKSTLAFQCALFLDPTFDLSRVHFSVKSFLDGLSAVPKGGAIVFDEALIISNRSSMTEANRSLVYAMSMIRSKQIHVLFCANSIFDLDRNLSIFRADLLLHVYGLGFGGRGRFAAFFQSSGDDIDRIKLLYLYGRKMYDYSKPKANFYGTSSKNFVLDEKAYEDKKNQAVNDFLKDPTVLSKKGTKAGKALSLAISYLSEKCNLTQKEISAILGLTERTLYNYRGINENE